jgi:hypothetical protein
MKKIPEARVPRLQVLAVECRAWVLELEWVQAAVCRVCRVCQGWLAVVECRGCPEWLAVPALQLQLLRLRPCFLHAPQLSSKK